MDILVYVKEFGVENVTITSSWLKVCETVDVQFSIGEICSPSFSWRLSSQEVRIQGPLERSSASRP